MFTGIIETTGTVKEVIVREGNHTFWIQSNLSDSLKPDQSISHSGACLTVEEIRDGQHRVTAIRETLSKTNLGQWKENTEVNLERCLPMNGRLDGHLVQGHVDTLALCIDKKEEKGSWLYRFEFNKKYGSLVIEKGSICLEGISLTVFDVSKKHFSVAIIPYTMEHTNLHNIAPGYNVNIEFDMIGKYINRYLETRK